MTIIVRCLWILLFFCLSIVNTGTWADIGEPAQLTGHGLQDDGWFIGRIESVQLMECSGMDISTVADNLFWAINDGGNGPFLYALGSDGRHHGKVRVAGVTNRDWEGIDTFLWQGRPMILIADFGDNGEQQDSHTLYIVEEPRLEAIREAESIVIEVAWRIVYSYPNRKHDAEGVAVDTVGERVLVLTKRDNPPLLFALPLKPSSANPAFVADRVAAVSHIPPPSVEDRRYPYGKYRSQPTALDLSPDGRQAVVLTYKHAYLFNRWDHDSWATVFSGKPTRIPLPLPQHHTNLRQREAICFSSDGRSIIVTSEGEGAALYQLRIR